MTDLQTLANKNISDICIHALKHGQADGSLVIFDKQNQLTTIVTEAFRQALPNAEFLDFDKMVAFVKMFVLSGLNKVILAVAPSFIIDFSKKLILVCFADFKHSLYDLYFSIVMVIYILLSSILGLSYFHIISKTFCNFFFCSRFF